MSKLVVLESPYAGDIEANVAYARRCARMCALMGEATQASHLYYTQFLDDDKPEERAIGIELGLAWLRVADYSVFFVDLGWSRGMIAAWHQCFRDNRSYRIRSLSKEIIIPDFIHEADSAHILSSGFYRAIDMEMGLTIHVARSKARESCK